MTYYVKKAKNGALFVYPTDTIYGVGGIVTSDVVDTIDQIKQRLPGKHYSIIAPSIEWISDHFDVGDDFETQWISLYQEHGPLTLILKPRLLPPVKGVKSGEADLGGFNEKEKHLDWSLLSPTNLIWVRLLPLPSPIQQLVMELWEPLITTSANISGQPNITHPDQLTSDQQKLVDITIDDGHLDWWWSTVINYHTWEKIR